MSNLYLSGVTGHYASTPDSVALSISGNIDVRVKVALTDWTPSAAQYLIGKYNVTGNQRSYALRVNSAGTLSLLNSTDGTGVSTFNSSVATDVTDGATKWLRVTVTATGYVIKFWTSDDGATWAQLGTSVNQGGTATTYDGSAPLELGSYGGGTTGIAGNFYRAQIRDNVLNDDTGIVFDADFTAQSDNINAFAEASSNHATVTIYGRSLGYEPTWLPAEALCGNANHYGYEAKKLDAPEPAPKTTYPAATGGTTYPTQR